MHRSVTSAPPWTGSRIHSAPAAFSDWHQLALNVLTQNLSFFGKHIRWQQSGKKQKWLLPTSDEQRCWCSRPTVPGLEIRCVTCGVSETRFSGGGLTFKLRAIYWHSVQCAYPLATRPFFVAFPLWCYFAVRLFCTSKQEQEARCLNKTCLCGNSFSFEQ